MYDYYSLQLKLKDWSQYEAPVHISIEIKHLVQKHAKQHIIKPIFY